MGNRRYFAYGAVLFVGVICLSTAIISQTGIKLFDKQINATEQNYSLNISSVSVGNFNVKTSSGYDLSFTASNKSLKNNDKIKGLKSISFESSLSEFVISYGYNENEYLYEKRITANSFDFDNNFPSYFKVSSIENNLDISNVVLSYSCNEASEPSDESLLSFTLINENTAYSVKATNKITSSTALVIPAHHNNLPVESIAEDGFSLSKGITSLSIPNTIKVIGKNAFGSCDGLTSVTIPYGVQTISNRSFYNCAYLKDVYIPDSVTNVEQYPFYKSPSIENINCPKGINTINGFFVHTSTKITSFTIAKNITAIQSKAFYDCSNLEHIYYEGSSTEWDLIKDNIKSDWVLSCPKFTAVEFLNK